MIFIDTSLLIDGLTGDKRSAPLLRHSIDRGERVLLTSIVLYEWLRGPRTHEDLAVQENLFPNESIVDFNAEDAIIAGRIYRSLQRPRGREIDIMIAACTIRHDAELWTLNVADFKDIPGLRLIRAK